MRAVLISTLITFLALSSEVTAASKKGHRRHHKQHRKRVQEESDCSVEEITPSRGVMNTIVGAFIANPKHVGQGAYAAQLPGAIGSIISSVAAALPTASVAVSVAMPTSTSVAAVPKPTTPSVPASPYKIVQSHSGKSFFDGWDFFNYPDPTHGQVNYLSQSEADLAGLAYTTSNGTAVMKVDDYTWLAPGQERASVRITSKKAVKIGSLVVMDSILAPYGPGVWPAFWSVGQNWPTGGEIDIFEGVHNNVQNQMTLHSQPGCTLTQPMQASGKVLLTDCSVYADSNSGCGVQDPSVNSYGSGWNAQGGGVYVLWWDASGISIWMFPRDSIPEDIKAEKPNFLKWGTPKARWDATSCDMNKFFSEQTLIFNITLCGDWAGNTFNQAGFSGTCSAVVQNPGNFNNAVFEVNSVKVYELA